VKILIVNRFFGGAQIPTGRMAEDVARLLAEEGHEVSALASSGAYVGAVAQALKASDDGVSVKQCFSDAVKTEIPADRTTATPGPRPTLRVETVRVPKWMPRALAWLCFTWQARKRIPRMDWEVCVLMTDPPLLPLLAARVKAAGVCQEAVSPSLGSVGQCFGRAVEDKRPNYRAESARQREAQPRATTETPPNHATRRVAVWLMDLYPEALAASGRLGRNNLLYKWYFNKRQRALGECDLLICLGEAQKALVGKCEGVNVTKWAEGSKKSESGRHTATGAKRRWGARQPNGIQQTRIAVVPPWDDRGNIALAIEESLENLALYAGNLGEAHCFEEILAAAPHLPGDWTIRFAARGAKFAALKEKAGQSGHGLTRMKGRISPPGSADRTVENAHAGGPPALAVSPPSEETKRLGARVEVTGYASEEETPGLLASARVHLITMSPGWEGIVVPSKLYGCIRTGRPVLFIGPENADTAREIRAHDWGKVLPPGASGEEVAAAILELAARETCAVRSENGAKKVAELIQSLATAEQRETA
jgi:hypothetical protein